MNLEGHGADKSGFVVNEEWHLTEFTEKRNEIFYDCCPEPYLDITYKIRLDRKARSWSLFG